ncbi:hypothetical protein KAJ27_04440 [bacterium]|nr:hypothetical protein [bacterium]
MKKIIILLLILFANILLFSQTIRNEEAMYWFNNGKYFFERKKDYFKAYQCFIKAKELIGDNLKIQKYIRDIEKKLNITQDVNLINIENSEQFVRQAMYQYKTNKNTTKALLLLEKSLIHNPNNETAKNLMEKIKTTVDYDLKKQIRAEKKTDTLKEFYKLIIDKKHHDAIDFASKHFKELKIKPAFLIIYSHLLAFTLDHKDYMKNIAPLITELISILQERSFSKLIKVELFDLYERLRLQKAVFEFNNDISIMKRSIDQDILSILSDNISIDFAPPEPMTILDMDKLQKFDFLKSIPICIKNGMFYLNEKNNVECSYHGLSRDTAILEKILNNPDKKYLDFYYEKKKISEIEITPFIKSIDLGRKFEKDGNLLLNQDKFKAAGEKFEKALQVSGLAIYYFFIGKCQYKLKDYVKAEKNFREFESRVGKNPDLYELLAMTYLHLSKFPEALEYFMKLMPYRKDNSDFMLQMGNLHNKLKQIDNAVFYFQKSAELNQQDFLPHYKIGLIYLKEKNFNRAHHYFMLALERLNIDTAIYKRIEKIIQNLNKLIKKENKLNDRKIELY